MQEQIIKYETANLAKEKGFNWYTSTYIDDENDIIEDDTAPLIGAIPAPTQSLLQKWLRDVHHIHIHIADFELNRWSYMVVKLRDGGTTVLKSQLVMNHYLTYEEALENGLIEALKLINV